jgi:hypothetical protein
MPDYVCPECWEAIVRRAVLVNGTLLHVDCYRRKRRRREPCRTCEFDPCSCQ